MDSHLPHCDVCLKSITSGFRCSDHLDMDKFPLFPNNPTDSVVTLEPCPFCGHPESVSHDRYGMRLAYVECLGCSAHGPAKDHEPGAIAAWNTRMSQASPPLSDEVERAARAFEAKALALAQGRGETHLAPGIDDMDEELRAAFYACVAAALTACRMGGDDE